MIQRCSWVDVENEMYVHYHDNEWGVPVYDDQKLFEYLTLEIFQSGLSWLTILKKRANFYQAFDGYDLNKIALYDEDKIKYLMQDRTIVRNKRKIEATIQNATVFRVIQNEWVSFSDYIWHFTNYQVMDDDANQVESTLSKQVASDLKKRGMKGVGSVTIYSYLEAIGIYNHHDKECFLHKKIVP